MSRMMIAAALLVTTVAASPVMAATLLRPLDASEAMSHNTRPATPGAPRGNVASPRPAPAQRPAANGAAGGGRYIAGNWYPNNSAMVRSYCQTNKC